MLISNCGEIDLEAWMRICVWLMLVLLVGCATTTELASSSDTQQVAVEAEEASAKKVQLPGSSYVLHHRAMPTWTFESDGAFYADLQANELGRLREVAGELVSPEYAAGIVAAPVQGRDAVVVTFPEPTELTACYFVLIAKDVTGFNYFTYEKTVTLVEEPAVGVIGGWTASGAHLNFGPRNYRDQASFIADVLQLMDSGVAPTMASKSR